MNQLFKTYSDSLFLSTTQYIHPVLHAIPASLSLQYVAQLHLIQEVNQVVVAHSLPAHVILRIWVDDLVSQSSQSHVRPLQLTHRHGDTHAR